MSSNALSERREWFKYFPEGTVEFVLVARVLLLILLVALAFVRATQRSIVLLAFGGVIWVDYVLMLWWAVQMAGDMENLFRDSPLPADVVRRQRVWALMVGILPSIIACLMLLPWPEFIFKAESSRTAFIQIMLPLLGVLYVVFVYTGQRALGKMSLGSARWIVLLLIPIVHWWAFNRLMKGLQLKLAEKMQERDQPSVDDRGLDVLLRVSDITWLLSILPWGVILILALSKSFWPSSFPYVAIPLCAIVLAVVFCIVNLAAMEYIQRRFVAAIRKL